MAEIAVAFVIGALVGGCAHRTISDPPPPPLPPPPPPPLPKRLSVIKRILARPRMKNELGIDDVLDSVTGEDLRVLHGIEPPHQCLAKELPLLPDMSRRLDLHEIVSVGATLRKAPRPMTIDEKRDLFFTGPNPVHVELMEKRKQCEPFAGLM